MILNRHKSRAHASAEVEVYLYLSKKMSARRRLKERVLLLKNNPGAVTLEDFDALMGSDIRIRRNLFKECPELGKQYDEYQDKEDVVLSSIHSFARRCYRYCGEKGEFIDGWHLRALCQEWEDALNGKHDRLMINQPPGTSKSWLSNVVIPAYSFAKDPGFQVIQLSYSERLPKNDGAKLLRLMRSDWYRRLFPHVQLTRATREHLETTAGGYRWGAGVGASVTGWHPDLINFDDPHKADDCSNDTADVKKTITFYAATIPSRGMIEANHRRCLVAIIMQRLGVNDLCAAILREGQFEETTEDEEIARKLYDGFDYRHVCLPMFYEPDHPYLYEHDPRTEPGELLWKEALTMARIRSVSKPTY